MANEEKKLKEWFEVVADITPFMVRVVTRSGHGTGFLLASSTNKKICGIATAYHVVAEAFEWGFPIRLEHTATGAMRFLGADRYIEANPANDTAVIMFEKHDFPLPDIDLVLVPETKFLKVASEVGWLGFPTMSQTDLCFFSGSISNFNQAEHRYLVDGVAINGVSGGPVLSRRSDGGVFLVGIISAYIPNISTGTPMPGLAVVRDVSTFFAAVKKLKSLPVQEQQEPPKESPEPEKK